MHRIDCSQRGAEKFLFLKALHDLKEERASQAGRLGVWEKTFPERVWAFPPSPALCSVWWSQPEQQTLSQLVCASPMLI